MSIRLGARVGLFSMGAVLLAGPAARAQEHVRLMPQLGFLDSVTAAAYTPDGHSVITGSNDSSVRIWDSASGLLIRVFDGNPNGIGSIACSPDGRLILVGGGDDVARMWDPASGLLIRSFSGHSGWITAVAFSPNGRFVLTGGDDKKARLWEASTGKELLTFGPELSAISSVAFFPRRPLFSHWRESDRPALGCGLRLSLSATSRVIPAGSTQWLSPRMAASCFLPEAKTKQRGFGMSSLGNRSAPLLGTPLRSIQWHFLRIATLC